MIDGKMVGNGQYAGTYLIMTILIQWSGCIQKQIT